ncbi:MAG: hypothetical protein HRT88_19265, partial [Lentisphaeraceae bacterium]|nr:hypothetical protein [Lentisphaeraceae bacterium]
KERQKAVKGILGMMYFGNYKSPVLLEALASLVYLSGSRSGFIGGQQIAARALLKASYEVKDEKIAGEYRHIANKFLSIQRLKGVRDNVEGEEKLLFIEKQFKKELADADTWFAEVEANEKMWLKNGEDLTKKYRETYAKSPRILQKK